MVSLSRNCIVSKFFIFSFSPRNRPEENIDTKSKHNHVLPEVVDEVVQQVHGGRADVVEGDGRVATTGSSIWLKTCESEMF